MSIVMNDIPKETINKQLQARINELQRWLDAFKEKELKRPFIVIDPLTQYTAKAEDGEIKMILTDTPAMWTREEAENIKNELNKKGVDVMVDNVVRFYELIIATYRELLEIGS